MTTTDRGDDYAEVTPGVTDEGLRSAFQRDVAAVLDGLRPGEVVTYGEVATEAGHPGSPRAVGSFLATHGGRYPWWRVVTADGRLVPGNETEHARRLRAEGVEVVDGRVRG